MKFTVQCFILISSITSVGAQVEVRDNLKSPLQVPLVSIMDPKHEYLSNPNQGLVDLKNNISPRLRGFLSNEANFHAPKTVLKNLGMDDKASVLFIGESHQVGAGYIGYYPLLRDINDVFPFDCVTFENAPGQDILFTAANAWLGKIYKESRLSPAQVHAQLDRFLQALPKEYVHLEGTIRLNKKYRESLVPNQYGEVALPVLETGAWYSNGTFFPKIFVDSFMRGVLERLLFIHSKAGKVRWYLVDDHSDAKRFPGGPIFTDSVRRNKNMAHSLSKLIDEGTCRKIVAINGSLHLTSNLEFTKDLSGVEMAIPLQVTLKELYHHASKTILLDSLEYWDFLHVLPTLPVSAVGKGFLVPDFFDHPHVVRHLIYDLLIELFIKYDEKTNAPKKTIFLGPPEGGFIVEGNIRSFDAILLVE